MLLIGLTGKAGVGKDSVADILQSAHSFARIAFADALKRELASAFGVDTDLFYRRELREARSPALAIRNCIDPAFIDYAWGLGLVGGDGLKPRTLMQTWGDYRRARNHDYFLAPVDRAFQEAARSGVSALVVTDVRFENEYAWLTWNGGALWRVARSGLAPTRAHVSEHALDGIEADAMIRNDGSVEDLRRVVLDLASSEAAHTDS